jgi:hypothetical protein
VMRGLVRIPNAPVDFAALLAPLLFLTLRDQTSRPQSKPTSVILDC